MLTNLININSSTDANGIKKTNINVFGNEKLGIKNVSVCVTDALNNRTIEILNEDGSCVVYEFFNNKEELGIGDDINVSFTDVKVKFIGSNHEVVHDALISTIKRGFEKDSFIRYISPDINCEYTTMMAYRLIPKSYDMDYVFKEIDSDLFSKTYEVTPKGKDKPFYKITVLMSPEVGRLSPIPKFIEIENLINVMRPFKKVYTIDGDIISYVDERLRESIVGDLYIKFKSFADLVSKSIGERKSFTNVQLRNDYTDIIDVSYHPSKNSNKLYSTEREYVIDYKGKTKYKISSINMKHKYNDKDNRDEVITNYKITETDEGMNTDIITHTNVTTANDSTVFSFTINKVPGFEVKLNTSIKKSILSYRDGESKDGIMKKIYKDYFDTNDGSTENWEWIMQYDPDFYDPKCESYRKAYVTCRTLKEKDIAPVSKDGVRFSLLPTAVLNLINAINKTANVDELYIFLDYLMTSDAAESLCIYREVDNIIDMAKNAKYTPNQYYTDSSEALSEDGCIEAMFGHSKIMIPIGKLYHNMCTITEHCDCADPKLMTIIKGLIE